MGKAAEQPLLAWFKEARKARWTGPADIKDAYRTASFVANNRVVFNVGGNKFRLIVAVIYATPPKHPKPREGVVYVRFVGTHKQYDAVDASKV